MDEQRHGRWDSLIGELHHLRDSTGAPSYLSLTRDLVAQRVADGQDEHAARMAKSSVHDAFRYGRSRINVGLVRELVRVMGGEPGVVDTWVARCVTAPASDSSPPRSHESPEPSERTSTPAAEPRLEPARAVTATQQVALALGCVVLNMLGRLLVDFFQLPLYLDMTGTAIAAIALGPWRGAAVGATTNVVGILTSGWISLPFALVNVAGALVWGHGVGRWRLGTSLPRFFMLSLVAAGVCSAVAVPLLLSLDHQTFRDGHGLVVDSIRRSVNDPVAAATLANGFTSTVDKLVSGFLALVVVSALPLAFRSRLPLVPADGPAVILAGRH